MRTEDERVGRLLNAQANAVALFDEVVARGIIAPGQGEQTVSDRIRDLANEMSGKTRHWHKRIGQMTGRVAGRNLTSRLPQIRT